MATLPDLTDTAKWIAVQEQRKAQIEAENIKIKARQAAMYETAYKSQQQAVSDTVERALRSGQEATTHYIVEEYWSSELMQKLVDWVNSHPRYKCKSRSMEHYHSWGSGSSLQIELPLGPLKPLVKKPPFWVRWFC